MDGRASMRLMLGPASLKIIQKVKSPLSPGTVGESRVRLVVYQATALFPKLPQPDRTGWLGRQPFYRRGFSLGGSFPARRLTVWSKLALARPGPRSDWIPFRYPLTGRSPGLRQGDGLGGVDRPTGGRLRRVTTLCRKAYETQPNAAATPPAPSPARAPPRANNRHGYNSSRRPAHHRGW